jgi:hypothetical protein
LIRLTGIAALVACVLCAGVAGAAMVRIENLILTADGGFTPRLLPKRAFAPIEFEGHADLRAVDGGIPPALQRVVLDFDRDGRLSTGGLPACDPALLDDASPAEARARCRGAIVGSGRVEALVDPGDGPPVKAGSPLTVFNGPRLEGHATAVVHARTVVPSVQTFVLTVPIERRGGDFRYRATIDVPPVAGGLGAISHVDATIGRRYRFRGSRRSYASARCSDGVLRTHGRLTFADTTIIDGTIEKACTAR